MPRAGILGLTIAVWFTATAAAIGQEPATRADADRERREEKQAEAKPYQPGGFERAMHFAEERAIFILDREGLYPKLGSLTVGSGFAYGVGFRDRDLFGEQGHPRRLGRSEHQTLLGGRSPADVPAAGRPPAPPRDLGEPARLSAGGLLRSRAGLEPRRSVRLRHPHQSCSAAASASGRSDRCCSVVASSILQPRVGHGRNTRVP